MGFFGTFVAGMTLRLFFVCIDLMDLELLIEEKQIALNSIVGLWRVNQAHLEFPKKWVIQSFPGWYAAALAAAAGSGNSPVRQTGNFQTREAADGSTSVQRRVYGPMIRGGAGAPACWLLR